jgi:hypothetical protein
MGFKCASTSSSELDVKKAQAATEYAEKFANSVLDSFAVVLNYMDSHSGVYSSDAIRNLIPDNVFVNLSKRLVGMQRPDSSRLTKLVIRMYDGYAYMPFSTLEKAADLVGRRIVNNDKSMYTSIGSVSEDRGEHKILFTLNSGSVVTAYTLFNDWHFCASGSIDKPIGEKISNV